ncbi:sugar-transfer associated ATP-grasp domain-containing protein [Isachenkonia alkalipeptolytica]|uniref:Alpha-L-glutamate ligase-related protein ATP-grasp domain-containing protein n=1 Tax=Isachenkonia alkalipeptolytica TaxID=2565777 RepID=A0AA43XL69_9CLOT|nr:sugar-transfer associated ATP-grasp domain-containing protein [Isachenkonia alkalipeptolytica]NBG88299.1 hypothetical protein [Isachenkonia alkalipeptolytica]
MERERKIKDGILKFIHQGNIKEAEKILRKYEEAQQDDPDIFNLKSMIKVGQGEQDKAEKILLEGIELHPGNFDMVMNLAFLVEGQDRSLYALDLYTKAYYLTGNNKEKNEAETAIKSLKDLLNARVKAFENKEDEPVNKYPVGKEATKDSLVLDVEIDKCVDFYNFNYGKKGWNPYIETIRERIENPESKYIGSALYNFFRLFRPKNLQEVLFGEIRKNLEPIAHSWISMPWGDYAFSKRYNQIKVREYPFFGLCTDKVGDVTREGLWNHYKLVQEIGYHPETFSNDYIKGYLLKSKEDYRFVVCEGHHRVAALAVGGYKKIRCHLLNEKNAPKVVDIKDINKWGMVKSKKYTREVAKQVFTSFFTNNGRERAIEADLLCDNLDPEKEEAFKKLGVNLKDRLNVKFYNAGLLNKTDEAFVNGVKEYWQKHYNRKIDPGFHLAYMNLTGKKEPRLIPHRIMRGEIIPLSNHKGMESIGYRDKNIYDKLIPTSRSPKNVLKRVCSKYFDASNNCLDQEEAYKIVTASKKDLIIKPSTTNDGIGIAKLVIQGGHIYLGGKIVKMAEIEKEWGSDFIIQEVVEQHSVMAKPHPASVNTLRMVTYRWKHEIKNLLTVARFGAGNDIKDNDASGAVSCGISNSGEFLNYAMDKKANVYTHHPTTNYCFADHAKVPNYEQFKKFVRDLHKEVLHHDYICWDIVVGVDGQPIFLELNFWGNLWAYQMRSETPFFGEFTEELLEYMKNKKENINN